MWKRGLRKSASLVLFGALALLSFSSPVSAARPEIPADGIDNVLASGGSQNGVKGSCPAGYMDPIIGLGCDLKSPSTVDVDDDGVNNDGSLGSGGTTDIDCDDFRMDVRPNRYIPDDWTTPTGYKKCQANGTFTSVILNATTPLCEAVCGGSCYYVDCGAGNNSNPGTYASPFLTPGKLGGGGPGSPPASPVTLTAGSVVYYMNTTNCSTLYSGGSQNNALFLSQPGSVGCPITQKRYPGATMEFVSTNGFTFDSSAAADFQKFEDIKATGSCTASSSTNSSPIHISGDDTEVSDSYFHDWSGSSFLNDSMVYANSTNRANIHHNFFKDWIQGTGACANVGSGQNVQAVKFLENEDSGFGQNHKVKYNTAWRASPSTGFAFEGGFIFYKHGIDADDAGADGTQVQFNKVMNATVFFQWTSSKLRASDNIGVGIERILYAVEGDAPGTSAPQEDNHIEWSTFVESSGIDWAIPPYTSTAQHYRLYRVVIWDTKVSYSQGNNEGIIAISGYGSDAQKAYVETNISFSADFNCYGNPNTALVFNYFGQTSGGPGPAGPAGGFYSFANWLANTVHDDGTVTGTLNLDLWLRPQLAGCVNMAGGAPGRRYSVASGGAPTTGLGGKAGLRILRGRLQ